MSNFVQEQLQAFRENNENKGRLIIKCPDQPGIVAAITAFLKEHHANIVELSQYSINPEGGTFFTRIEFETPNLKNHAQKMEEDFSRLLASSFRWNGSSIMSAI